MNAINNRNDIAGSFSDASSHVGHAFVLADGVLTTFQAPDATVTVPSDMNDSGTLVGFFQRDSVTHGFQYSEGMLSLVPYGESQFTLENWPTSINNRGDMVGWSIWGLFPPVITRVYFTYFDNQYFGGANQNPRFEAVNDARHVAVFYRGVHALFTGGGATLIDSRPELEIDDVNNLDTAVGTFIGPNFERHGFVWTNGKSVTVDYPGGLDTRVNGVNDAGIIVGSYFDPAAVTTRGFVATPRSPVDVKINGSDGPVTLDRSAPLQLDLAFQAPPAGSLDPAELYLGVVTPVGVVWIDPASGFVTTPTRAFAGPLSGFALPLINLPNSLAFPPGTYTWFMLVDDDTDGVPNGVFSDLAQVTLQ